MQVVEAHRVQSPALARLSWMRAKAGNRISAHYSGAGATRYPSRGRGALFGVLLLSFAGNARDARCVGRARDRLRMVQVCGSSAKGNPTDGAKRQWGESSEQCGADQVPWRNK